MRTFQEILEKDYPILDKLAELTLEERYSSILREDRDRVYGYFLKLKSEATLEVSAIKPENRDKFVTISKYAEKWDDFKLHGFRIRINLDCTKVKKIRQ